MQIASRQPMWNEGGRGTVVEVKMTPTTGLKFQLAYHATSGSPVVINWGDGEDTLSVEPGLNVFSFIEIGDGDYIVEVRPLVPIREGN